MGKNKGKKNLIKKRKFNFSISFILTFLYSFFCGNGYLFLLYTLAVSIHELFHIFVSIKLGYTLDKFELSITGASMNLEDESFYGKDEIIIALAGPLINLFIFLVLVGLWWIEPVIFNYTFDFALVNLFVFALNILPIYSLDGGRIIVALFSEKFTRHTGIKLVKFIGIVFSVILFVLFIVSFFVSFNFSLGVMSVFLFASSVFQGKSEFKKINIMSKKDKLKNGLSLEIKTYIFSSQARLINLYRKLRENHYTNFIIVKKEWENDNMIDEDSLILLMEKYGAAARVSDCISKCR